MEDFIARSLTQASLLSPEVWTALCKLWNWLFWIGFLAGIVGALIFFFLGSREGA